MIVGLTLLLVFQIVGNILEILFHLPVPGAVIGMFLLLLSLICIDSLADYVRPISLTLVSYLAVMFVPAGVGIMLHAERIKTEWFAICASLLISTVLAIAVTGLVVKYSSIWLEKRQAAKTATQENAHE